MDGFGLSDIVASWASGTGEAWVQVSQLEALVHDWVAGVRARMVYWTSLRDECILVSDDLDDDNVGEQG